MFHDTFDACCNAIFNPDGNNANFSCKKYDVICNDDDDGGGNLDEYQDEGGIDGGGFKDRNELYGWMQ